jgi:hypothetical protein
MRKRETSLYGTDDVTYINGEWTSGFGNAKLPIVRTHSSQDNPSIQATTLCSDRGDIFLALCSLSVLVSL